MRIYCKRCPLTVRSPRASSWESYGLCPACADDRKYKEYNDKTTWAPPKKPYKVKTDVDLYWDRLMVRAVSLGEYK